MVGKIYRWSCFLALSYSGYRLFSGKDIFQTLLFTFLCVLFTSMLYIGIKMKEPANPYVGLSHPDQPLVASANKTSSSPKIPQHLLGVPISYQYQDVAVAMESVVVKDFSSIHPGDLISFIPEPTNQYDSNAIQLRSNNQLLGYVFRGIIQDMMHDYLKRGDPIHGSVSSVLSNEKEITYNLGFYREPRPKARGKVIGTGRLTASSGEEAQDNIASCEEGEELSVSFDSDKCRYEVSSAGYIGCLPKKLEDYYETATFVIDEIGESDSGKTYIVVTAYEY